MTEQEKAVDEDFELGWSPERIVNAEFSWGAGIVDVIPHGLAKKLAEQAQETGENELSIITKALFSYFENNAT